RYGETRSNTARLAAIARNWSAGEGRPQWAALLGLDWQCSGRLAIKRAQFVAVGIAQISEIHLAGRPLAHAGRVLDGFAAIRDACLVPGLGLVGTAHQKADRAAIGMAGRLPSVGFDTMKPPPLFL